ncbi:WhiB family transcriptional regulator [Angustibacter speluncae]
MGVARASFVSWEWQERAACRHHDETLFVGPDREQTSTRRRRERRAVQVCWDCPVLAACRRHALDEREPHGVWGGLTEEQRATMLRHGEPPEAN